MENPAGNRKLWKIYAELSHRGVFFATVAAVLVGGLCGGLRGLVVSDEGVEEIHPGLSRECVSNFRTLLHSR